jgi:diadenosine tetraphosphate (Ap4A) HIT family hydrolase
MFCNYLKKDLIDTLILENEHAFAVAENYFREGHCTVIVKRHIDSISKIERKEYSSIFDLITKVSKALEKIYDCEKTYLLSIGDQVGHLHFHLIPKHKNLCSMGKYCFRELFKAEGERHPLEPDKFKLASSVKSLINTKH